jgi:hypothetical protein
MCRKGLVEEYPQSIRNTMNKDKLVQGKDEMGQEIIEARVTLRVEFMRSPLFSKLCFCRRKGFKPKRQTRTCCVVRQGGFGLSRTRDMLHKFCLQTYLSYKMKKAHQEVSPLADALCPSDMCINSQTKQPTLTSAQDTHTDTHRDTALPAGDPKPDRP